jgi:adenosylhomocysteine nucleosidase
LHIHIANLLTVPALIDSPEERNKLALASGAVAADMETEFIARAFATCGIPLLSLRVISDTPHNRLPAPANVLFDIERQQTRMLKLATHLLAHPNVPRLAHFATGSREKDFSGCISNVAVLTGSVTPAS